MQSKDQIKPFLCNLHPSETIQRVCLDSNADTSLRCLECILSGNKPASKGSILTLEDFIENAAKQYKTFKDAPLFEGEPPQELVGFLCEEDERIERLSQEVEQEKERVNAVFSIMVQEFTALCHSKKEEVVRKLDRQVLTLKLNYGYYKSKVDKYYHTKKDHQEVNLDREALIEKINQCESTNEMELLVKNIKDDIFETSSHQSDKEVKELLKDLSKALQEHASTIPKSRFCDQATIEESLKEFREMTTSLMEDLVEVEDQISEFSFKNFITIDSEIIKKYEDLNLLKKWLAPSHENFKLRLLYRGSRDGMTCETFHQRCDNKPSTLVIAKSNYGKVFGGYSDQTWNGSYHPKTSEKSWLFSIDEKQKFPIMPGKISMYTHENNGPCFGSGHDLYLYLSHKNEAPETSKQSYSSLGSAYLFEPNQKSRRRAKHTEASDKYGNNSLAKTILAGAYQFDLEEVEVYSIEPKYEARVQIPGIDSMIINLEEDLNLMKEWLGKEKQHDFELIYRGSQDGFSSEDFHKSCDNAGPTLVVCKSKVYDRVFGGFTSKNWSRIEQYVEDPQAFLFSLTGVTKHVVRGKSCAIYCSSRNGPTFGEGHDLLICSDGDRVEDSKSVLGTSYRVSSGLGDLTTYLGGASKFLIDEIEVFKVVSKEEN